MSDLSKSSPVTSSSQNRGMPKLKFAQPLAPPAPLLSPSPTMPEVEPFGGINASHLSGVYPKILVQTGGFTTPLAPTDSVSVYWNSPPMLIGTTTIHETTSGNVYVQVDGRVIWQHGEGSRVYYYIQRNFAGTAISSNVATVLVKYRIPGEDDQGSLTLTAPVVTPAVIGAGTTVTVTIDPWQNAFEEDRLILLWGAVSYEVPGPFAADQPVAFVVPPEIIVNGGSNPAMEVSYRIVDQVGNWSRRSPVARVHVQADNDRLKPPMVIEAPGGVLDLTALKGDDVHVQVDLEQAGLAVGDTIFLTWKGMTGEGTELPYGPFEENVTDEVFIIFTVPHARVAPLGPGGSVSLYYEARTSEGTLRSAQRNLTVTGEAVVLDVLRVREARDGVLDPEAIVDGVAHLDVGPYPLMALGDEVTYYWTATSHGGATVFRKESRDVSGNDVTPAPKPLVFTLTREEIERIKGYAVSVHYTVRHFANGVTSMSKRLELRIAGVIALPPPRVDHEEYGYLDPAAAPTGTNIRVRTNYSDAAHGDFANVYWDAPLPYQNLHAVDPDRLEVVSAVGAEYITGNEGHEVTVSYVITRDGQPTHQGGLTTFLIGTETVVQLPAPGVLEAGAGDTLPGDAAGATVRIPAAVNVAVNDVVTVFWNGVPGEGSVSVAKTVVTEAGSDVHIEIPDTAVFPNAGQAVHVMYTIARAASGRVDGPSLAYLLNVLVPVFVEETFESGLAQLTLLPSQSYKFRYFLATNRATNADPGFNLVYLRDAYGQQYAPHVSGTALEPSSEYTVLDLAFDLWCTKVTLGVAASTSSTDERIFAYSFGEQVGSAVLPPTGTATTVTFNAPAGRPITNISVRGVGDGNDATHYVVIDNIVMTF
ncbi:hypothetical protein FHW69_002665 [Luteibacter sp. Sphag1AF]|uniref:hypothetical protein n=1 Tax=Luteibacter sp. Sphag1AF TaxID=2587031 RepID=UPI00160AD34F|nr:hypothetical protein [Luteibacter sp. Sphag1AF]MBB3228030.1 hypothetical protein [Luteibacter sp. Sphag1AF]